MKSSLIILGFFTAGVIFGSSKIIPGSLLTVDYSSIALYLLMFLVGIGIGADTRALKTLYRFNFKILVVPITTIVGTLTGVFVVFLFLPGFQLNEILAVGSGFGYYSLSSIIITNIHSQELGVVALLSNVMREIITLLMTPLFALYFGKLAPICSAGATSMDTTLPIITSVTGKQYGIISLFHGIVLTIIVPFLVTFFITSHIFSF